MKQEHVFSWLLQADKKTRNGLIAASLGWMLDAFDVMLFALVVTSLLKAFRMDKSTAGLLGSLTLIAAAFGGMIFGVIADRYGRTRAMMASIAIYSVFTAACGFSTSILMLAVFRVLLGLGMGGEWASGAALVSETWPDRHRGKALGFMQSFWAIGYCLAAIAVQVVLPKYGWRAVFFIGIVPAIFIFWIRSRVEEPEIWQKQKATSRPSLPDTLRLIFQKPLLPVTLAVTAMNACALFGWWGFNLWIPGYLSLEPQKGGLGLLTGGTTRLLVVMQVGMWLGYMTFGYVCDRLGRKRAYVIFLVAAFALVMTYAVVKNPVILMVLGPAVAFFGTGHFTGFGAVTAEIYPTSVRATAQGFTYNTGRIFSAIAPFAVGSLSEKGGFALAFMMTSGSFLLAALLWIWIPETKGRSLK